MSYYHSDILHLSLCFFMIFLSRHTNFRLFYKMLTKCRLSCVLLLNINSSRQTSIPTKVMISIVKESWQWIVGIYIEDVIWNKFALLQNDICYQDSILKTPMSWIKQSIADYANHHRVCSCDSFWIDIFIYTLLMTKGLC